MSASGFDKRAHHFLVCKRSSAVSWEAVLSPKLYALKAFAKWHCYGGIVHGCWKDYTKIIYVSLLCIRIAWQRIKKSGRRERPFAYGYVALSGMRNIMAIWQQIRFVSCPYRFRAIYQTHARQANNAANQLQVS